MSIQSILLRVVGFVVAVPFAAAHAQAINSSLSVNYYSVVESGDPDFGTSSGNSSAEVTSALGPDGLPVALGSAGLHDITAGTNELTWWSPNLNSNVTYTGTGTANLPFSNGSMYTPNGTGSNDGSSFLTAILSGSFTLTSPEVVQFSLGSDDDSFFYVDGTLVSQEPGIHGTTNAPVSTGTLGAGAHTIEVFYADRQRTGAQLDFAITTLDVLAAPAPLPPDPGPLDVNVPEPASLTLLGLGLVGLGAVRRRRG